MNFKETWQPIFMIILTFLLMGFTNKRSPEDVIKSQFYAMQKDYFLKLDLRAPSQALKTIPSFSAKLSQLADEQRAVLATDKNLTKDDKALAGLIFVYDAMLNCNNIIGILDGKLSLANFTKEKMFSKKGSTERVELAARAKQSISELQWALKLRPNDHRIDSWIVGATGVAEIVQTGHITKATQNAVIKAIDARPSFNLWTAILLLHNEPPAAKQALLQAAKNFIEAADQGKDPCTLHPEDCLSTWKAPYNYQASVTELGDVFLQQAEYFLEKNNQEKTMTLAGFAKGTYAQLFKPKHIEETKKWPDHEALTMRKQRLAEVQNHKVPTDSLHTMSEYQRVYECASCHGRR